MTHNGVGEFFTEEQTRNIHFSIRVKRWLHRERTPHQMLEIADTEEMGRLLALDGKIMLTERDERFYHEMLVHPPMLLHPQPQRVLIIGGGDGGTLREVLRHPSVQNATLVELDANVIEACRKWLPSISCGALDDERSQIIIERGEQFVSRCKNAFDVIIVDSTDPVGPALPLFSEHFFESCHRALAHNGIFCTQCGTPFYFQSEVAGTVHKLRNVFHHVQLYLGFVPSYPSGLWAYCMASDATLNASVELLKTRCQERGLTFAYYSPEVHDAALKLPAFVRELIDGSCD